MTTEVAGQREQALQAWARECLQEVWSVDPGECPLEVVSGDASFRRYFRLRIPSRVQRQAGQAGAGGMAASYILVDAPPQHEDCQRFVVVADRLRAAGLAAPVVHEVDYLSGFMLLQDFGDTLYLPGLLEARKKGDLARADTLYKQAMQALISLQAKALADEFPSYDRALLNQEMALFPQWYCGELLGLRLTDSEQALLTDTFRWLEDAALGQEVVCVHRDYHSRNLMVRDGREDQPPGVVDFQDAVAGPYTYDLVSLLRDCYIVWPLEQVQAWALAYLQAAKQAGILPAELGQEKFLRDFDLMGLQRHIKVVGIFSRLSLRDGKHGYLQDIPTVIDYILSVAIHYPELQQFEHWLRALLPQTRDRLAQLTLDEKQDLEQERSA